MKFTIFTKPWKSLDVVELAQLVNKLGFDGVEFPIRDGYQVSDEDIHTRLPVACKTFNDYNLFIGSIAPSNYLVIDEHYIETVAANDIRLLRVCLNIDMNLGYFETEKLIKSHFDKLMPILESYNVCIGVQNHCKYSIGSAVGIMHLIEQYDDKYIGAVYDPAHCAIDGEPVDMGFNIIQSRLKLVNFKSAYYRRTNNPNSTEASWNVTWVTAKDGAYSWRKMANCLIENNYDGQICLPAEYSDPNDNGQLMGNIILPYVKYDFNYLRHLLGYQMASSDFPII